MGPVKCHVFKGQHTETCQASTCTGARESALLHLAGLCSIRVESYKMPWVAITSQPLVASLEFHVLWQNWQCICNAQLFAFTLTHINCNDLTTAEKVS